MWCAVLTSFCFTQCIQHAKQPSSIVWQLSKWSSLCPHWFFIFLLTGKYPQGAPHTLCPPAHLLPTTLPPSLQYLHYPSIYPPVFISRLPEQKQTAEHLRELNGFQLAKQIPLLMLTLSHGASEILGGHYRQLEFNKPNMLTVLMEREEERWGGRGVPSSLHSVCYTFLIALNHCSCPLSLLSYEWWRFVRCSTAYVFSTYK